MTTLPPGPLSINVSTIFPPTARTLTGSEPQYPDTIVYTSLDATFFYCHQSVLKARSSNSFNRSIPASTAPSTDSSSSSFNQLTRPPQEHSPQDIRPSLLTITVAESSAVLNVLLHFVYNMPYDRFASDFATMTETLGCLNKYGIALPPNISNDVWSSVVNYAQHVDPIRAFAIAAHYSIEELCVKLSPYTLTVSLNTISEEAAETMGPSYLRRLLLLHMGRRDSLKGLIDKPPLGHAPTAECTTVDQIGVAQAWELAVTDAVLKQMAQALTPEQLQQILVGAMPTRACRLCNEDIQGRTEEAVKAWQNVRSTI